MREEKVFGRFLSERLIVAHGGLTSPNMANKPASVKAPAAPANALSPLIAFIAQPLDVQISSPFELHPGMLLRRPAPNWELAMVARYIDKVDWIGTAHSHFQGTYDFKSNPPYKRLPMDQWFYWVIEFDGKRVREINTVRPDDITDAFYLNDIDIHLDVYFDDTGPRSWSTREHNPFGWKVAVVSAALLQTVKARASQAVSAYAKYPDLKISMEMLRTIRRMKPAMALSFLGLFAVIESLLTHDPKGGYDSLGHQIRTKIALLDKRLAKRLDYQLFGSTSADTVWKKLYACRSAIAHGGKLEFSGDLKALESLKRAFDFLERSAKSIMYHAIDEPQLITDLRAC